MPRRMKDGRAARTQQELVEIYQKLLEISAAHPMITQQAEILGATIDEVYRFRLKAGRAGYVLAPLIGRKRGRKPGSGMAPASQKLLQLDAEMSGEACCRCGLHGTHGCTKVENYMRTGEERTYPGHTFDGEEDDRAEDVTEAA